MISLLIQTQLLIRKMIKFEKNIVLRTLLFHICVKHKEIQ